MRNSIFILFVFLGLVGCKREDLKEMSDDLKDKKTEAVKLIEEEDHTLPSLMKIQEYFFTFSERVHLMIVDEDGRKAIQASIEKAGAKGTCDAFIVSSQAWSRLDRFCSDGAFYKCSPEIQEYKRTLGKFKELSGAKMAQGFDSEPACIN